jgi:hypothetical protein
VLGHVLAAMSGAAPATTPDEAFHTLAGKRAEFEGISYLDIGTDGAPINEPAGLVRGAMPGA